MTPKMVPPEDALPGRDAQPFVLPDRHHVLDAPLEDSFPGMQQLIVAMGCFWGAERKFWQTPGVVSTAVGYAGGTTPHPTYKEVCSGQTRHTEVVRIVFDPAQITSQTLLRVFWENHDPTQGMRQGNDVGTQYRSAVYWMDEGQKDVVLASRNAYQHELKTAGFGAITTEVAQAGTFYFAEEVHQQYLAKNPDGYCGIGGTGVVCSIGLGA